MVRALEAKILGTNLYYKEFSGLHDDDKPTQHLATGSVFLEVDTGDVYLWDEDSESWLKVGE